MKVKITFTAESNTSEGIEILQALKNEILSGEFQKGFQDCQSSNIKVKTAFEYIER